MMNAKVSKNSRFFHVPGMVLKYLLRKKEAWTRNPQEFISAPRTSGGTAASVFSSREVRDRAGTG